MDDLIQILAVRNHQHGKGWAKKLIADPGDELDTDLSLNQFARFQALKDRLGHALGEPHPAVVREPMAPISDQDVDTRISAVTERIDDCVASGWHDTPSVAGWLLRNSTDGNPPIPEAVDKSRTLWALIKDALDI